MNDKELSERVNEMMKQGATPDEIERVLKKNRVRNWKFSPEERQYIKTKWSPD